MNDQLKQHGQPIDRGGTPGGSTHNMAWRVLKRGRNVSVLLLLVPLLACVVAHEANCSQQQQQIQPQDAPDLFSVESEAANLALALQLPDYVIDDLADNDQMYASGPEPPVEPASLPTMSDIAAAAAAAASQPADGLGADNQAATGKRSLSRRQLQVFDQNGEQSQAFQAGAPYAAASMRAPQPDFERAGYPLANFYFDQSQQQRTRLLGSNSAAQKTEQTASSSSPPNARLQQVDEQAELEQHEARLLQQNQNKVGPRFVKEPPSFMHYLNSSDLIIPCAASGNPTPTITWWQKSQQLKLGSLLDKRYVRYDDALVISAFKPHEFEPEIHSASYRCQASNPLGTIVSRDVVINAVIDQDYEANVADQFVTVDNDALFKCQLPPQVRDIYQVTGWLEDGQQLGLNSPSQAGLFRFLQAAMLAKETASRRQPQQPMMRAAMLPSGHLYIPRVQLRDANKSYKCQIKNLLSGRLSASSISGRLFVTDANESGASPRIIDGPAHVTAGRLGEPLLLGCIAQGSPRPTVRWFRWQRPRRDSPADNLITTADQDEAASQLAWVELQPTPGQTNYSNQNSSQSPSQANQTTKGDTSSRSASFVLTSEGNFLLLKSPQPADQRAKFKCLANNSFGAHQLETELRLDSWGPIQRSVELRPRLEFIQDPQQVGRTGDTGSRTGLSAPTDSTASWTPTGGRALTLNCTVRMTSQPLVALEWLKNGQQLFGVVLASHAQLERSEAELASSVGIASTFGQQPTGMNLNLSRQSQFASIFDEPSQELLLVEHVGRIQPVSSGTSQDDQRTPSVDLIQFTNEMGLDQGGLANGNQATSGENLQVVSSSATLEKLSQMSDRQQQVSANARSLRLWHSLRLQQADQLLYQLHFNSPMRRADRGTYQCRTKSIQLPTAGALGPGAGSSITRPLAVLQQAAQLLLKDTPPKFMETFANVLVEDDAHNNGNQRQQVSLKCVASGSPLPEISWLLSGFQVPETSRFRVGDYVTRDGLIVSFVNISNVQPADGGLYECSASNDVGQLRHSAWLNVTGPTHIRPMPNVSAIAGGSLSIMCPVGGWPIEQISWFQNSTKLPSNHRQKVFPNGTLVVSELNEVLDSGHYACQAKSTGSDHFALQQVHVSIKVPPVVEPFTFAKSLHRGQRYNIMCMVTRGDLPVSIRWFKDGQPIEAAGAYIQSPIDDQLQQQFQLQLNQAEQMQQQDSAALTSMGHQNSGLAIKQLDPYSSTLTFASLQSRHRGLYSCEAVNEAGRANQSSALVIHVPPEWRIEPTDLSVTIGRTAVVDCQADGFPAARIEWRLSPDLYREPPSEFKPIISSLYMRVFENGSLIIYNTQRTDAGYYLCQANNGVGPGISKVIKLTVHVAAHFKSKIRTELVRRGQPARLKCEAFGDLPIEISWLKDKQPLYTQEEPRYALTNTQLQEGIFSELTIHETTRTDSALFTCITQNQFGTDDTNIQLVVQGPPDPPDDVRVLDYEARSAKLSWLPGHSGNSPILKYVLMYAPVAQLSSGGGGGGGNGQQPSLPVYQRSGADHYQHELSSGGSAQPQWTNVTIQGNESSYLLQGLAPLTEYHCHLIAINSLGASRLPGEPIKFRTDDEAPSLPPVFVKAQATSSRTIKIRWRAPERRRDQHYGSIAGFYVGYKLYRPATADADNQQRAGVTETAASTPEVGGPTLGETGSSGSRSSGADSTRSGAQVAANRQHETFVYKTIEFNQRPPVPAAAVQVGDQSAPVNNKTQQGQLDHECQLNALKRGQKYLITVQPFNGRGAGPASEPVLAETWRVDVPDSPSLRMIARTTRSIHLGWRLAASQVNALAASQQTTTITKLTPAAFKAAHSPLSQQQQQQQQSSSASRLDELLQLTPEELAAEQAQANEPIVGFILARKQLPPALNELPHAHYSNRQSHNNQEQPSDTSASQQQQVPATLVADSQQVVELRLPSDHLTHIVDNLTCGTRYQFTIAAINSVGASAPSEPLVVKTEGSVPVAPDRSSLLSVNASSVVINLGAWHNGACSMRSFDVLFKPSRSKKWTSLTNYQFGTSGTAPGGSQQQRKDFDNTGAQSARSLTSTSDGSTGQTTDSASRSMVLYRNQSGENSQQTGLSQRVSGMNELQIGNGTIVLDDLATSINYDLKILATNEAGTTEALYTFNTNGNSISSLDQQWSATGGEFQFSEANLNELFASSGSLATLLPVLILLLLVSLSLSTGCILFARRRRAPSSNCSLSSSSRSNHSNYCGTTTTTTTASANGGGAALLQGAFTRDPILSSCAGEHDESTTLRGSMNMKGGSATLMSQAGMNARRTFGGLVEHASLDDSPLLAAHHHHSLAQQQQQSTTMRLSDIYGTHQRSATMQATMDKTHYAHLTADRLASSQHHHAHHQQNRPASPHNTDVTSVLNGSEETEMCLGASALNLANAGVSTSHNNQQQQLLNHEANADVTQHPLYGSNTLSHNKSQAAALAANNNYHTHHFNGQLAAGGGKLAAQLMSQLGKSSTLPSNCHQQQMLQKLLLSNQQQHGSNNESSQQAMLDSLMAANLLQPQHDLTGCPETSETAAQQQAYALQAAIQAANDNQQQQQQQQQHTFDQSMMSEALNLANINMGMSMLEQQHHHQQQQVYATVKRGFPRPPNNLQSLCDYTGTIYQCPGPAEMSQQRDSSQLLVGSCCSGQASSSGIGSDGNQAAPSAVMYCYNQPHQEQPSDCALTSQQQSQQQQQQQQHSDYQQLRPMN